MVMTNIILYLSQAFEIIHKIVELFSDYGIPPLYREVTKKSIE